MPAKSVMRASRSPRRQGSVGDGEPSTSHPLYDVDGRGHGGAVDAAVVHRTINDPLLAPASEDTHSYEKWRSVSVAPLHARSPHTGCTAQHACCILRQPCVVAVRSASIHAMRDIARLIPSTGSCRVTLANVYGATMACEAPRHDQSEARNASRGSSAWNRCHVPSIGTSFHRPPLSKMFILVATF
jgi:hypothetical protein